MGYYGPASTRSNLHLVVRHYAGTVRFNGTTADGVTVHDRFGSGKAVIKAAKEVILAAGTINTAKVLQQSGLGAASRLEALGIKVVSDLPGVGMNLQDHPYVQIGINCKQPFGTLLFSIGANISSRT